MSQKVHQLQGVFMCSATLMRTSTKVEGVNRIYGLRITDSDHERQWIILKSHEASQWIIILCVHDLFVHVILIIHWITSRDFNYSLSFMIRVRDLQSVYSIYHQSGRIYHTAHARYCTTQRARVTLYSLTCCQVSFSIVW